MIRTILVFAVVISVVSCTSVKKFNAQLTREHTVTELHADVDYALKKLKKLHPDLYWYISKEVLEQKFDSLKNSIKSPMSSQAFYKKITPVITSIRQGHTSVGMPGKRQTKKEVKEKGVRKSPFKSLRIEKIADELVIKKNHGKDSTKYVGETLLKVDGKPVEELLKAFKNLQTGDGYNQTFIPRYTSTYLGYFYEKTHPQKDSVLLTLKKGDLVYESYLHAIYSKSKSSEKKKDSIRPARKKISREEKRIAKAKRKSIQKYRKHHGYNPYTKEYNRNFTLIRSDTLPVVGYMKIRGFSKGRYKEFYEDSFQKMDSAKASHLVLDLRGNLGGRLSEIDHLYAYLTDKEYVFIKKATMTSRTSNLYPLYHSPSWFMKALGVLFSPGVALFQVVTVKKDNGIPYFKFKYNKSRTPKERNYKGAVYVLIDGESFSASSILSTHLKATGRATFIGEETGGAYNGTIAGVFANVELPTSKLKVRIGLMNISTPYETKPDGYGIKPDITIPEKHKNKDSILQTALQQIAKTKEN
ncbi:S41 family peptidase [Aquimarina hainanensis]|uniref:S41 family peptidase n=1 Tax=Aquimarina hainanensis TaxID=1578017 RepID=A0ABW5N5N8_9FLAO